jgi:hypothetical protein
MSDETDANRRSAETLYPQGKSRAGMSIETG